VVVTISTSARLLPFLDTLLKVKRLVSLLLGEPVCYVVPRRPRNRYGVCIRGLRKCVGCVRAPRVTYRPEKGNRFQITEYGDEDCQRVHPASAKPSVEAKQVETVRPSVTTKSIAKIRRCSSHSVVACDVPCVHTVKSVFERFDPLFCNSRAQSHGPWRQRYISLCHSGTGNLYRALSAMLVPAPRAYITPSCMNAYRPTVV
jgi:hypothetical protein